MTLYELKQGSKPKIHGMLTELGPPLGDSKKQCPKLLIGSVTFFFSIKKQIFSMTWGPFSPMGPMRPLRVKIEVLTPSKVL